MIPALLSRITKNRMVKECIINFLIEENRMIKKQSKRRLECLAE